MAMDPGMQGGGAPVPPEGGGGAPMPPGEDEGGGPLTQMIVQTDQALSQIAQVLAKASPQAARALMQINQQYRDIIQGVMSGQDGGGAPEQGGDQMAPPETQGKASMMAY